jgi:D-threo-aldose 1-dehydrogenase
MARTGRRDSLRLLEVAFDAGITHFDVARSYGYGEAESAVGEFAATRRGAVTIATKLGVAPPARSRGMDLARAGARVLARAVPPARRLMRRGAERMVTSGSFELEAARESLETSLRELRTDYVDLLLLHDCAPEDVTPELLEFLRGRVAAGQVRCYGIATGREAAREILATNEGEPLVVQAPFDPLELEAMAALPNGAGFIGHSVLGDGVERLQARLAGAAIEIEPWSGRLGADLSQRADLGRLLIRVAIAANPDGVFLFSSRDEGRIRANAALGEADPGDAELPRRFADLLAAAPA